MPPAIDPSISGLIVGVVGALIAAVATIAVVMINRVGKRRSEDTDQVASFVTILQNDNATLRAENASLRAMLIGQIDGAAHTYFPPEPPELPPASG